MSEKLHIKLICGDEFFDVEGCQPGSSAIKTPFGIIALNSDAIAYEESMSTYLSRTQKPQSQPEQPMETLKPNDVVVITDKGNPRYKEEALVVEKTTLAGKDLWVVRHLGGSKIAYLRENLEKVRT